MVCRRAGELRAVFLGYRHAWLRTCYSFLFLLPRHFHKATSIWEIEIQMADALQPWLLKQCMKKREALHDYLFYRYLKNRNTPSIH